MSKGEGNVIHLLSLIAMYATRARDAVCEAGVLDDGEKKDAITERACAAMNCMAAAQEALDELHERIKSEMADEGAAA